MIATKKTINSIHKSWYENEVDIRFYTPPYGLKKIETRLMFATEGSDLKTCKKFHQENSQPNL